GVALDRARGLTVALDEDGRGGAARERLEAHRPRAGKEVEDGRFVDRTDQVEGGLADPVAGRARVEPLRREDPRALAGAGDDPHPAPATAVRAMTEGQSLGRVRARVSACKSAGRAEADASALAWSRPAPAGHGRR